ncbi:MAG TPA: CoA transferase, partial [Pseudomonadales bacterium]|nr:CoA transferase [Pseudomonadales bacterium]
SKLSLQCNLSVGEGRQLARRVCDWADVVVESFSPGTMARMGLGYDSLSAKHPELIMLSTSMLGQSGPLRQYAGFGQQATGFCGLHYITGWPDRLPCGVASPYTDVVAPKFGIAGLAAAILERRRSGQGQFIDLSQAECAMMFMAPLILDASVNGKTAERTGMDSIYACPHGVYPTAGTERYIAISAETTDQWHRLRDLLGDDTLKAAKYDELDERRAISPHLHELIAAMSKDRDPWQLEAELIATGIPASVVQRPMDVFSDPQIEARGLKQILRHSECGDVVHYGFCTRFSAKSEMVRSAPPCLGEHNDYVLSELLGLAAPEIEKLRAANVFD